VHITPRCKEETISPRLIENLPLFAIMKSSVEECGLLEQERDVKAILQRTTLWFRSRIQKLLFPFFVISLGINMVIVVRYTFDKQRACRYTPMKQHVMVSDPGILV
jgi:hypothetical protein